MKILQNPDYIEELRMKLEMVRELGMIKIQ